MYNYINGDSTMTSTIKVQNIKHTNDTTAMTIDAGGRVLTPAGPSFYANKNGHLAETNGTVKIGSWTTIHDIGNNFNATTGDYTCPVAGVYFFAFNWMHGDPAGDMQIHAYKNSSVVARANQMATGSSWNQDHLTIVYEMGVNDTFSWYLRSTNSSTYGVYGGAAFSNCMGYLIG